MEQRSSSCLLCKIKRMKLFEIFLSKDSFGQFCKYLVVGASSFALEYTLFYLLIDKFDVWYILANSMVYFFVFWFNFILNRIWSFKSKLDFKKQLFRYAMLFIFNLLATTGILYVLSDVIGIDPRISKVIVMMLIVPWNFTMYKKVIYK